MWALNYLQSVQMWYLEHLDVPRSAVEAVNIQNVAVLFPTTSSQHQCPDQLFKLLSRCPCTISRCVVACCEWRRESTIRKGLSSLVLSCQANADGGAGLTMLRGFGGARLTLCVLAALLASFLLISNIETQPDSFHLPYTGSIL